MSLIRVILETPSLELNDKTKPDPQPCESDKRLSS